MISFSVVGKLEQSERLIESIGIGLRVLKNEFKYLCDWKSVLIIISLLLKRNERTE